MLNTPPGHGSSFASMPNDQWTRSFDNQVSSARDRLAKVLEAVVHVNNPFLSVVLLIDVLTHFSSLPELEADNVLRIISLVKCLHYVRGYDGVLYVCMYIPSSAIDAKWR